VALCSYMCILPPPPPTRRWERVNGETDISAQASEPPHPAGKERLDLYLRPKDAQSIRELFRRSNCSHDVIKINSSLQTSPMLAAQQQGKLAQSTASGTESVSRRQVEEGFSTHKNHNIHMHMKRELNHPQKKGKNTSK
jgi:hypothetical protein